jgi:hypothetical protein
MHDGEAGAVICRRINHAAVRKLNHRVKRPAMREGTHKDREIKKIGGAREKRESERERRS